MMEDAGNLLDQIETLERQFQELQERIDGVRGRISEIERQNAELDRDIKQVQKAILERENSWVKGLLITAAIVAACLAANHYLAPALASSTSGAMTAQALPLAHGAQIAVNVQLTSTAAVAAAATVTVAAGAS
jgi:septal ring factor EnvC (AmiA/AmiB activator)